jgi:TPR repeat protein
VTNVPDDSDEQRHFNDKVFSETDGWALPVSLIRVDIENNPDRELHETEISGTLSHFFNQRADFWLEGPTRHVLPLLAIFERIGPLSLEDVQLFLNTKMPKNQRLSLPDLRALLAEKRFSEQLRGLEANKVKLAVKSYADHLCKEFYSASDLQGHLKTICEWLAEDPQLDGDLVHGLFRTWGLHEDTRLSETVADLCDRLAENERWDTIVDSARALLDVGEPGQPLAKRLLETAAQNNSHRATWLLGRRLLEGDGFLQDIEVGRRWLTKAAEAGDTTSMLLLGSRLLDGHGLEQDIEEGRRWLTRAAEEGCTFTMRFFGLRLIDGDGLEQNSEEGRRWLTKAVEEGDTSAMRNLGSRLLAGNGLDRDPEEGRKWLTRAAEEGDTISMWTLGIRLIDGEGLEQNAEEGRRWLTKAAQEGDTFAMGNLGRRLLDGDGLEQNAEEGRRWFTKAAEEGDISAMRNLGNRLLDGDGLEQDTEEGHRWLTRATEEGDLVALNSLGLEAYAERDFRAATEIFLNIFQSENADQVDRGNSANNLLYMKRRGEVPDDISTPADKEILRTARKSGPKGFVPINTTLCQAAGLMGLHANWKTADGLIARLKLKENWDPRILDWWKTLADSDDDQDRGEGNLIVGWLVRHGIIEDPDGRTVEQRLNDAKELGWEVPDWMFDDPTDESAN